MTEKINKEKEYPINEAAKLLEITIQTIAKYLREGSLKGMKRGPKQKWHVRGDELIRKRREWGYNSDN